MRLAKKISGFLLLVCAAQSALGFALLGPVNEPYQSGGSPNEIDYNFPGDIGAPKNIGEEYRWNTPTLYYAFDQSFLDYFGTNGITAIEEMFAILNSLDNVSSYSADLSEFPLDSQRVNFKAQALQLIDLKSLALHLMVEQLGLAEPDRYTWTLHNRFLPPGASCPAYIYAVIKRNFDPITWEPSSYVNGTLYSYNILEFCPTPSRADAVEFQVDPLSVPFTAVASDGDVLNFSPITETDLGVARYGFFYTGLTRDDVGGLRYLLRSSNINRESTGVGFVSTGVQSQTFQFVTNSPAQLFAGSNLTLFAAQALTNNAAALQALYPDLVITGTTNLFVRGIITNVTPFFTNSPWDPVGTPPHLAFVTNFVPFAQTQFRHTFANLVTFQFINGQWVTVPTADITTATRPQLVLSQTTTVTAQNAPFTPVGTTNIVILTNTTTKLQLTNTPTGEFFILPTNFCDVAILGSFLTNVFANTNIIATTTNTTANTNVAGVLAFTQAKIDFFTNHSFIIYPIICATNTVASREGIERMRYVRTGRLGEIYPDPDFIPITNIYNLTASTNGAETKQTIKRIVTQPDILFSAQDLGNGPGGPISLVYSARSAFTNGHVDLNNVIPGLAGPGIVEPPIDIIFNKFGPIFLNAGPLFIDEASALFQFQFGSFDGTTNDPIVYPSGSSIRDLESGLLMQIILPPPISAAVGNPFTLQLDGIGGQPPYSWDIASGALPPGLTLTGSGIIIGTPTSAGTYDVTVEIADSAGHSAQRQLTLVISN